MQVETIGDAYMVVGGAPVKTKLHAVRIVEMAFAMVKSIVQLSDPSTGDPISIRVGKYVCRILMSFDYLVSNFGTVSFSCQQFHWCLLHTSVFDIDDSLPMSSNLFLS